MVGTHFFNASILDRKWVAVFPIKAVKKKKKKEGPKSIRGRACIYSEKGFWQSPAGDTFWTRGERWHMGRKMAHVRPYMLLPSSGPSTEEGKTLQWCLLFCLPGMLLPTSTKCTPLSFRGVFLPPHAGCILLEATNYENLPPWSQVRHIIQGKPGLPQDFLN